MATHNWGTNRPLSNFLFDEAHLFDFYQAVRLIEKIRPSSVPVGENDDPSKEAVRFKSRVSVEFPASDIEAIRSRRDSDQPEMVVNFMGLAGVLGPLPNPFVELIIEREVRGDTGFRDFLDIFNHRLVSIMYRLRKTHRLGLENKSPDQLSFAQYLYALMGIGTKSTQGRLKVRDRAFLYYTGLIAQKPHSMSGLERLLSHYFRVVVRGIQLIGRWHNLDPDQVTIIGRFGQNRTLGDGAVLGTRIWDQQTKFRLVIGPLTLSEFEAFLPIGPRFTPLLEITRFYVGPEMDFEINLVIKARDVQEIRLGATGLRLGWTSWLKTKDFMSDDAQVVLQT
jgi:type VI secretion system protein ImpH